MTESIVACSSSAGEVDWDQARKIVLGFILNRGVYGLTYEEAEDIASETITLAWMKYRPEYRSDLSSQEAAQCLAVGIATKQMMQWQDRQSRRSRLLNDRREMVVEQTLCSVLPPDVELEAAEGHQILKEAINSLPENDRMALYMWARKEPMSNISSLLEVKIGTARQRVRRSLLKVKTRLVLLLEGAP